MDHRDAAFGDDERPRGQPADQRVAVRRGENGVERVAAMRLAVTGGDRQQVEVVIAEHRDGGIAERHHFAQYRERSGPAVDEVADEPQPIAARRESDEVEQFAELGVAALDVADRVERHVETVGRVAASLLELTRF